MLTIVGGISTVELAFVVAVALGVFTVTRFTTRRWLWSCGLVGCLFVAAANTPADVVSTIIIAVQLCALYVLSAFAWNAFGKASVPSDL